MCSKIPENEMAVYVAKIRKELMLLVITFFMVHELCCAEKILSTNKLKSKNQSI